MDWPRENIGINERDFEKVFRYEPRGSKVITRLERSKQESTPELIYTDERWEEWMDKLPSPDGLTPGLILVLARRTDSPSLPVEFSGCSAEEEKGLNYEKETPLNKGGDRSVRNLPFSPKVFKLMSKNLYIHGSIARVISRSDVPHFSRAEIEVELEGRSKHPAYVYNCRSTNAWEADLALTVTHFPRSGLTYAVLFGCPKSIEDEVIKRLSYPGIEFSYPLLLPGIFAELEGDRHLQIVEDYMSNIEEKIFELDYQLPVEQQIRSANVEARNKEKRAQWLDTAYLKNSLVTWNAQLFKMTKHVEELRDTLFAPYEGRLSSPDNGDIADVGFNARKHLPMKLECHSECEKPCKGSSSPDGKFETNIGRKEIESRNRRMRMCGVKIDNRLRSIIEEYEDKIRECAMRLDGMAMATQWSHGDTNVEIALATGRDSRYMRSIAVVTMVFLPGTFCASIFSMQFFNWFPKDNSDTVVSYYFWIYILVTLAMTLLTLGVWYYVSRREKQQAQRNLGSQEDSYA
ncbi:hypothetical protein K445DRAFT_22180 [Daldinia sp. EC12]|nr:hypothetical protein K445DRAFT_22180 [Daldinia sp. EC12]